MNGKMNGKMDGTRVENGDVTTGGTGANTGGLVWNQSGCAEEGAGAAVVLVEDNPLDAELALRALRTCGIRGRLLHLRDGQEAIDYFFRDVSDGGRGVESAGGTNRWTGAEGGPGEEAAGWVGSGPSAPEEQGSLWGAPLPRVLLLDWKLPKRDGTEVLRAVRNHARTRFLPVVVLTSSREERDLMSSYHLGANSYIVKPVNYERYLEAVTMLGVYWITLNQVPEGSGGIPVKAGGADPGCPPLGEPKPG